MVLFESVPESFTGSVKFNVGKMLLEEVYNIERLYLYQNMRQY